MAYSDNAILEKVYAAKTDADRRAAYDEWSNDYDHDVLQMGIRLPFVAAAVFASHVKKDTGNILDAGCGTGMHTEPLVLAGYGGFIGVDISEGMLALADKKNLYENLQPMALDNLQFAGNRFAVSYCIGALAPGHGPPESFDELARVTRPNGLIIFSTHAHDTEATKPFHERRQSLVDSSVWRFLEQTQPFVSIPGADSNIQHAVYVYQKC